MKNFFKVVMISFLAITFFTASGAMAADVAKIGVFDYQRFLENSKAGQRIRAILNKKKTQFEGKLKEKGGDLEKIREQLDRESMVMSPEKQEEKRREFRIKVNDYKELESRYTKEIKMAEYEESKKVFKQINEILTKMGKDENYLMIINNKVVFYAPNQIDITDEVIKIHDKKFSKNG